MLTPTLNGITASVRCVSSLPVVINAKLQKIMTKEERWETMKPEESDVFLQGGTQTLNSCLSLDYARDNESCVYFNDLCKLIEI